MNLIPFTLNYDSFFLDVSGKREHVSCHAINRPIKISMRKGETGCRVDEIMLEASLPLNKNKYLLRPTFSRSPQKGKLCMVTRTPSSTEKHLNSLNSYLVKLHNDDKQAFSKILNPRTEKISKNDKPKVDDGLRSLENYLGKVKGVDKYYDTGIHADSLYSW